MEGRTPRPGGLAALRQRWTDLPGYVSVPVRLISRMLSTIAAATLFVFVLLEISFPGGFRRVVLGSSNPASPRSQAAIEEFHLDENVLVRYLYWLGDAVRGDFGTTLESGASVTDILLPRLSITLEIMLVGVFLTLLIGIPLGLLAVNLDGTRPGRLLNMVLGIMQSVPVYITPIFLIWFFAVRQGWLPAAGWTRISDSFTDNIRGLILPIASLVFAEVGSVARIIRADVVRVMDSEFIAAARGKGLSEPYVLFRHALRPASLGLLNTVALNIGALLTGALIIELIFGIGAIGQTLLESTLNRDLYLILGVTTYVVVVYVVLNTIVDGLMALADPRIRR